VPFPDGAVLAKLAWKREPSPEFPGAFVPGRETTVQIMIEKSKRATVKNHDLVFTRLAR
jgi:hypothetical protein